VEYGKCSMGGQDGPVPRLAPNFAPDGAHCLKPPQSLLSMNSRTDLAMESPPTKPAEVIRKLASRPTGPFQEAGKPTNSDWDEALCAHVKVPAGRKKGKRVRIGFDRSKLRTRRLFSNDLHRMVIGRKKEQISTPCLYSQPRSPRARAGVFRKGTRRRRPRNRPIPMKIVTTSRSTLTPSTRFANLALGADRA